MIEKRKFTILLPDGKQKTVSYSGKNTKVVIK